jgi:hypothetical protein
MNWLPPVHSYSDLPAFAEDDDVCLVEEQRACFIRHRGGWVLFSQEGPVAMTALEVKVLADEIEAELEKPSVRPITPPFRVIEP